MGIIDLLFGRKDKNTKSKVKLQNLKKETSTKTKNNENSEKKKTNKPLRVNWDDTEDIGIVTHYKGKPFTGTCYSLYKNGAVSEECEMLKGLKEGKYKVFSEEGKLLQDGLHKNDEKFGKEIFFDQNGEEVFHKNWNNGDLISVSDFNFKARNDSGPKVIIDWFKKIGPIYKDNGESILHHNTLYSSNEDVFIMADYLYADFAIDTILDKYGGKDKFQKLDSDDLTDSFKSEQFSDIWAFYIGSDFTVLCKADMLQPYHLKEIIIRNIDSQNIEDIVLSKSKFASGWTLSEMENTFAFAYRFAFKYYADSEENEDNIRSKSIIEFIQIRYKNTNEINSIENNNQWIKFSLNMMNINFTKDLIIALQNMQKNKRHELLFLLKLLLNSTIYLAQKSDKSIEEVNSIISDMNELYSHSEKMLKTSLSNETYESFLKKHEI